MMVTSPRIFKELEQLLDDDPQFDNYDRLQYNALYGGRESSWTMLCVDDLEIRPSNLKRILEQLELAKSNNDLRLALINELTKHLARGIIEPEIGTEKIARIGLPLHLRLLHDIAVSDNSTADWSCLSPLAIQWFENVASFELAEAWWLWCHISHPDSVERRGEPVQIGTVAVEKGKGRTGSLKVSSVVWPPDAPKPSNGFVPDPRSFAYCLDDEFRQAFSNCYEYLRSIGVWDDGVVVEWDLNLDGGASYLKGGSIGAALALAAGALLARQKLSSAGA